METKIRRNDKQASRWFSTGFMVGGVGSVDAEKHTLHDAVLIRPGEALGHGMWIDAAFCEDIAARGAAVGDKGMKARFGHPNMCNEALGTFLGRWKNARIILGEEKSMGDVAGQTIKCVVGDLFLSSTAAESPKGDLRKYVEEMAAKEPQHFGASIVFTMDRDAMWKESVQNGAVEKEDEMGAYLDFSGYKSPDPANVKNLPHARCAELHAADLVDDPAATDGMFAGAGGLSLAAQMTEWLDTHPGVLKAINDEPELLNIVTRYADELKPFLNRYTENLSKKPTVAAESAPVSEPAKPSAESVELQAKIIALEAQASVDKEQIAKLTGDLAGMTALRDKAITAHQELTGERDGIAVQLKLANEANVKVTAERDEATSKIAAIEKGATPVSATQAETTKESAWKRAQKK